MATTKKSPVSRVKNAVKKTVSDVRYAMDMNRDNPGWREGGTNKRTLSSVRKDVQTHRALQDTLNKRNDNWAGSSIASIKHLREATGKACGGSIRRKKSK